MQINEVQINEVQSNEIQTNEVKINDIHVNRFRQLRAFRGVQCKLVNASTSQNPVFQQGGS